MRLRRLYLRDFKNLRDFEMDFADCLTTVLVGPNGTGKSNVLEALIIIFRDLDLGASPAFAYQLEYRCSGTLVSIDADPERADRAVQIDVGGERWGADRFSRKGEGTFLPGYVFGYYSGPSNRMERHFELHQERFAKDLRDGVDKPLRPLLYARLVHSQFVLLSFFARESQRSKILDEFLRITDLESVLFVLKRPDWYNRNRHDAETNPGDARFWGARGVVKELLARLHELALAPLRRSKVKDRIYLYLKNRADLISLAEGYTNQEEFFKALESLYISDLVEDVRTNVKIRGANNSLTFRELSEGEQQLLMVLGLLRFIEGKEGLILLDEPDTHLNPAWGLEYTHLLKSHVADQETTQIVMATHDPLVVAGLTAPEVQLMRRDDAGRVAARHPDEDPKGMGVAGLLTSELYGLRSQLDWETLHALDRKRELATKETLSNDERGQLRELNELLGNLDFSKTTRDPLYKPFVQAMTSLESELGLKKAVLSPEEVNKREDLAAEVVRTILARLDLP